MITAEQLIKIAPYSKKRAALFVPFLNAAMEEFEINTPVRQVAFLSQLLHESSSFLYMEEIADGSAYDNRVDLGNTKPEAVAIAKANKTTPGRFWKGHGPLQVTGYSNHLVMMMALGIDCLENPKLLCEPENGCRAAAYFWQSHGLNELADTNTQASFIMITKSINGGINGLASRLAFWVAAKKELGVC